LHCFYTYAIIAASGLWQNRLSNNKKNSLLPEEVFVNQRLSFLIIAFN